MSGAAKQEYLVAVKPRYRKASRKEKQGLLDEVCAICEYNRKYAIRVLNGTSQPPNGKNLSRRGRKKQYSDPVILEVIKKLWVATNLPCSKRLKAIIPVWLPCYPSEIPAEIRRKLSAISPATIDRLMAPFRSRYCKKGLGTTKPGSILKKQIPIQTDQWDEQRPGFLETDAIAHCGTSTAGQFVYTINCVDLATGWTEQRAVWGKGEKDVLLAIQSIENHLPFPVKGFDCDNGSEFLNWHLYHYLTGRKDQVSFTRSRSYKKNDNAHIEEKNWTHVRQYLGYERFEKPELVPMLNDLYQKQWNLYFNFFIPSMKLIAKHRVGSKVIKRYDTAQTPFQRILQSTSVSAQVKTQLKKQYRTLNPFQLQKEMSRKIKAIMNTITP